MNSFIKLEYIVLLGKTGITIGGEIYTLQQALYTPIIAPFSMAVMWFFFYIVVCCYLTLGLIFAGSGLSWILAIENSKNSAVSK